VAEFIPDSSVLIDFFNAHPSAVAFAGAAPSSLWRLHPAAEAEVLAGARDRHELRSMVAGLAGMRRVRVTSEDFDHCLAFVRRLTLAHGVGWPDCLIAASALRLRLPVATINDKHFRAIKGLRVVRPY
jgi:predicted nucleic acid-binding protein